MLTHWLMSGRSLDDDDDVIQAAGTYMLTVGKTPPGKQALHGWGTRGVIQPPLILSLGLFVT